MAVLIRALACLAANGLAFTPPASIGSEASDPCSALAAADWSALPDAPAKVLRAERVPATATAPAHCRVQGHIRGRTRFEARMPSEGWNGKHLMRGCGGFCGFVPIAGCDEPLRRGYACIASDMGHASSPTDGVWAYNDREAELDFALRATHATAVLGKALATRHYGRAPDRSYFEGCSTGGRQGVLSALRFPDDFDGVIAGAPVLSLGGIGTQLLWSVRAAHGEGRPVLDAAAIEVLRVGVRAACDRLDGLADGIIDDPRACAFDPRALVCTGGRTEGCLSPAQAEAAAKIYAGPVDGQGRRLHAGGAPFGSEHNWIPNYVGRPGEPAVYHGFIGDLFRYLAFTDDPGPEWRPEQFDFDRDPPRLGFAEHLYSATSADLRRFQARGGKLIVYQGWADQSVVPAGTIDWYELLTRASGGPVPTEAFARLFMVPGMNHCSGGPGATEVDWLRALEHWVEDGVAPDRLVGTHRADGAVRFTRPLVPYPRRVRLRPGADPSRADSFELVTSR